MPTTKLIGGFFEMALPEGSVTKSIAEYLSLTEDPQRRFINGRSALMTLVRAIRPKNVWLPAYVCCSVLESFANTGTSIEYFPVGESLEPHVDSLNEHMQPGDLVLAVNYFGRAPEAQFRNFAAKRKDLVFVEDCAQALDTGVAAWGNYRLYSPRKLVGVADGGYVVPAESGQYDMDPSVPSTSELAPWHGPILRFEDLDCSENDKWHSAHQQAERSMHAGSLRSSRLSHELLKRIDAPAVIRKRKSNFAILAKALPHLAFFTVEQPAFCPLGFPLRIKAGVRDVIRQGLIERGIFPAIHWADLPSPAERFPVEHQLSRELLTLPCDHRYGADDMHHIAEAVQSLWEAAR